MKEDNDYREANRRYFKEQRVDKRMRGILFVYLAVMFYCLIYHFKLFLFLFLLLLVLTLTLMVYEIVEWLQSI